MQIGDFIKSEIRRPYQDGKTDCTNTADRWIQHARGFSPLARYGRPIRTREDVESWLSERFGLIGGILKVMRQSGFARTEKPKPGDVGLIEIPGFLCVGIFTGQHWFSRNVNGIIFARRDSFLRAWAV